MADRMHAELARPVSQSSSRSRLARHLLGITLALLCLGISGCGGCWRQSSTAQQAAKEEEEKQKKKRDEPELPPLSVARIQIQPHDDAPLQQNSVKPGHWMATIQGVRSNHRDMQVEVESYAVDTSGRRLELDHLPYELTVARPGALPKGQARLLETWDKIPRRPTQAGRLVSLERRIAALRGGREEALAQEPTSAMPDYQYFFLVLAETPDSYKFTQQRLYSLTQPPNEFSTVPPPRYYRVLIPRRGPGDLPLPTHSLTWTSIAYVVWDNIHPAELKPSQQEALLDWIHWGGQLVVSGPGSLEKLAGSFLEPYLPADRQAAAELTSADFAPMDEYWSQTHAPTGRRLELSVLDTAPVSGVQLQVRPDAALVEGCGELVAERRVGAGRIVVTAFPLVHRVLLTWPCYDGFFNGALLRHPGRTFRSDELQSIEYIWRDRPALTQDPRFISSVRYLSRDAGGPESPRSGVSPAPPPDDYRLAGCRTDMQSGVGGWNDFSQVSNAARDILREAAGISIPSSTFVLRVVIVYLLILTALNWGFFRLIGRVEWAWAAAPIIAIVASLAVVRLAQLDIGFARSHTEIATLEIHSDFPRAHLTRYTALYTSLSTSYQLEFADTSALAQPMASNPNYQRPLHDDPVPIRLEHGRQVRLQGFSVISNSTGLIHSEQMFNLGGTFQLDGDTSRGFTLSNASKISVRDAAVFRRRDDGTLEVAWLGELAANNREPLQFQAVPQDGLLVTQWDASPIMSGQGQSKGEVNLRRLVDLVVDELPLAAGDMRLVGWSDQNWEGQTVRPAASQIIVRTLVVAHLARARLPAPERDANLMADFTENPLKPLTDDDLEPVEDAEPEQDDK